MKTHATTSTSTLTPNALNQLTARTVPGEMIVRGHVAGGAQTAQIRNTFSDWTDARPLVDGSFAGVLPFPNSGGPNATVVEVQATKLDANNNELQVGPTSRRATIPPANEVITHDADGNMTSDGLWTYECGKGVMNGKGVRR